MQDDILRTFIPIDALSARNFQQLADTLIIKTLPEGKLLFKSGDTDQWMVYLLKGEVKLRIEDRTIQIIQAGTEDAKYALSDTQPRKYSAVAATDITFALIDRKELDIMLTWDQANEAKTESEQEQEDSDDDDWMSQILRAKVFYRIPPANIQAVFMKMEPVHASQGDVIISEGDEGDYFYIIREGRCEVSRKYAFVNKNVLAELGPGDSFGEEALVSDAKRNATITMITDGILMRLGKEDFKNLLNEPLMNWVTYDEAESIVELGGQWLDVRLPNEHEKDIIKKSQNIPLASLRNELDSFDPAKKYIVYCDTGRRSSAAAYILNENGIEAYALKGGLAAI